MHRRGFRQDAKPAKRVNFLELAAHGQRDCLAADTMEPVTTRNEIAIDPLLLAVDLIGDIRRVAVSVVDLHVLDIEDDLAVHRFTCII